MRYFHLDFTLTFTAAGPLVVIPADRIVHTEHRLRRDGFAPRAGVAGRRLVTPAPRNLGP